MEGLLILIGVYVLDIVIKKVAANKQKNSQQVPRPPQQRESSDERSEGQSAPKSLQDLIKQFEEAQRRDSQGSYVPPAPPVEDLDDPYSDSDESYDEDEDEDDIPELPTVEFANPNRVTFKEIAESVIQWEEVCVEYLTEAFGFSESTAQQVLAELQEHHIVGRDMGEGYCDLLVHDKTELENLFKREQRDAEERDAAEAQQAALRERREAEAMHQKELAELEERARKIREQAGQQNLPGEELDVPCLADSTHKAHSRSFDRAEIRRGFIWAKVLDEPRFKKRWSSRVR